MSLIYYLPKTSFIYHYHQVLQI